MSVLNDTWRFLVARRLWPVAILLVAAAVAVPKLLSEEPTPAPAPTVAVKSKKEALLAADPIVTAAADGDRSGRRRVLGSSKDPFKPQVTPTPTPKPETAKTEAPATGGKTESPAATTNPTVGGSPAPDTTTPVVPPKKKYELYELTVRFGPSSDSQPPRKDVKRLRALPSADEPVLIYLGLLKDNKTAVFLLDSGVIAQGDATCRPTRNSCETIHIREGETEFLDVAGEDGEVGEDGTGGAQYQLDVLRIRKTTTTKASKAKAAVSKKGQQIVRARIAGDGPLRYRYDKQSGRLEKLTKKAYKAVVAKAAKAARAHF